MLPLLLTRQYSFSTTDGQKKANIALFDLMTSKPDVRETIKYSLKGALRQNLISKPGTETVLAKRITASFNFYNSDVWGQSRVCCCNLGYML